MISFCELDPKVAEGLRANGNTHVAPDLTPDSVHYLTENQPEILRAISSLHSE
jgi:hypothetical protein